MFLERSNNNLNYVFDVHVGDSKILTWFHEELKIHRKIQTSIFVLNVFKYLLLK